MNDDNSFLNLINELKQASKECWAAQIALRDVSVKYAPLCIQILVEGRQIPKLINNRIEKRKQETGWDPIHPDFWNHEMITALSKYFENNTYAEIVNA